MKRTEPGFKTTFTKEENQFLRDNFFTLTNQQLTDALGMTLTVVRNQCRKLGLRRNRVYRWTQAQTAYLVKQYPIMGDVEIAENLNRRWPRSTRPWTRKHVGKKRGLMGFDRTTEQLAGIRERNASQGRYNLDSAHQVFLDKMERLDDDYILSNCLRISKPNRPAVLKDHPRLIQNVRDDIYRRRIQKAQRHDHPAEHRNAGEGLP